MKPPVITHTFQVWYMRPAFFSDGLGGAKPDPTNLTATHIHLTDLHLPERDSRRDPLEYVFAAMQAEVWSANGEANDLITRKGLLHTSMSVGDVIVTEENRTFVVASIGFNEVRSKHNEDVS